MTRTLRSSVQASAPKPADVAKDADAVATRELAKSSPAVQEIPLDHPDMTRWQEISERRSEQEPKIVYKDDSSEDEGMEEEEETDEDADDDEEEEDYAQTPAEARRLKLKQKKEQEARQADKEVKKQEITARKKAEDAGREEKASREAHLMDIGWKTGQRTSLLDLPNEVIEQCFSIDQDLGLADFLSLGQTCRTMRDSMDDLAWESIVTMCRPNKESRLSDLWSLHSTEGRWGCIHVGPEAVTFDRARYCRSISDARPADFHYRGVKMRSASTQPTRSADQLILEMARDLNALALMRTSVPTLTLPVKRSKFDLNATQKEKDDYVTAVIVATAEHDVKVRQYNAFMDEVSRIQLRRLPLSRKEEHDVKSKSVCPPAGSSDTSLPIGAPNDSYSPWKVLAIRAINYPVVTMAASLAQSGLALEDIKEAMPHVAKGLVETESWNMSLFNLDRYFYKRDFDRLMISMAPLITERRAKKQAIQLAEIARQQKEYNKEQARYKALEHPICLLCEERHKAGHSHYRRMGISCKKKAKKSKK